MRLRRCWALALWIGILLVPAAAQAAVPGLDRVTDTLPTPNNSASPKTFGVSCPGSKQVVGVGGAVVSNNFPNPEPFGQVVLDDLTPGDPTDTVPDLDKTTITGVEDQDGTNLTWGLRAEAMCANPLTGLGVLRTRNVSDDDKQFTTTRCPGRNGVDGVLTGAAMDITGARGQAAVDALVPVDEDGDGRAERLRVEAFEDESGFNADWQLDVHGICANPVAGQTFVAKDSAGGRNSLGSRSATVDCPLNRKVLGAGWDVLNPDAPGEVIVGTVRFNEDLDGDGLGDGVSVAAHEDQDGTDARWAVRAYAICASP